MSPSYGSVKCLQTLHGYYKSSVLLVVNKNLDEGFAVLRMAAELARDVRCIYSNNHLMTVWLKKSSSADAEKAYRKSFSFNVNTAEGKTWLSGFINLLASSEYMGMSLRCHIVNCRAEKNPNF